MTTLGHLSKLLQPSESVITPSDLEKGWDVYIKVNQENLSAYAPIITLLTDSFFTYFKTRPDASTTRVKPILMLLDEFSQLSFTSEAITSSLATLRSKKISVFMACQSLGQLRSRYGHQGATVIMDNCRYISVMSASDPESQRLFADMIGKKRTLKTMGASSSESEEYIIRPEMLSDLGDNVVILADGKYVVANKIRCYEDIQPLDEGLIKLRQNNIE